MRSNRSGPHLHDLPTEFRADGASCASNGDDFAGDVAEMSSTSISLGLRPRRSSMSIGRKSTEHPYTRARDNAGYSGF